MKLYELIKGYNKITGISLIIIGTASIITIEYLNKPILTLLDLNKLVSGLVVLSGYVIYKLLNKELTNK